MRTLTYYYSKITPTADELLPEIKKLCDENNVPLVDICIDGNHDLEQRLAGKTPSVWIGPYKINHPFELKEIEIAVKAALSLDAAANESETVQPGSNALSFTRHERFSLWFSRSYVWVISIFLILFTAIAFLPPLFERNGNSAIAAGIYKAYSILCHQLAYRSYFIGGEQIVYPRELAHINGILTYEEVTGSSAADIIYSRSLVGNSIMGYKVALCERDIAIYLSMALFGIVFEVTGKKIKGLRWYLWFLIALAPIAIDGFSQLPGLAQGWPAWLPVRESTPFLRSLTGALFGAGTAWYMYPLMEETMSITRFNLNRKLTIIKKINPRVLK